MKYTLVYRNDKKNEPDKHLILELVPGDNIKLEVPTGYSKMTIELETSLLPVKQVYEKLGVEYLNESQMEHKPVEPVIEIDYSKKV